MNFVVMQPDCGYRRDYLWLPKKHIQNAMTLKQVLSFPVVGEAPISLWMETDSHYVVPRHFIPFSQYGSLPYPIIDINPSAFPHVSVFSTCDLRGVQKPAFSEMTERGDGIISIPPGKGKTVLALLEWVALRCPGLIIVHTQDLAYQWRDRILEHTTAKEDDIGWVQGDKSNWERPITIAMLQTLVRKVEDDALPEEFRRHFGYVCFDEIHHLAAPMFNKAAALGYGRRRGLSATHEREDGMSPLFYYHVGPVLFESREHDVIPETFFMQTGVKVPAAVLPTLRDVTGEQSMPKLYAWLAANEERNNLLEATIRDAMNEGRKVLALSDVVEHLEDMHRRFPESGLLHGKIKGELRQDILNGNDLVFATTKLAQEGLDRKDLDTIIVLLPLSSEARLRQILGRIQRACAGKQQTIAVVFEDEHVKWCKAMCMKLRNHLAALGYPYRDSS